MNISLIVCETFFEPFHSRALHIHAKFLIKRELDDAVLKDVLTRPNVLTELNLSHHVDDELRNRLKSRQLPRLGETTIPQTALAHLTCFRLIGIRLTSPSVLAQISNLQELSLDLGQYVGHANDAYSQSEVHAILDHLCNPLQALKSLTITVDDASPSVLEHITRRLPDLEGLHLVGADINGFLPTVALYTRDVTEAIVRPF